MRRTFLITALTLLILCVCKPTPDACLEVIARYPDAFPLNFYPYSHNEYTQDDLNPGMVYPGRTFQLSQDYPEPVAVNGSAYPWLALPFTGTPENARAYLRAVLSYAYQDNLANDWYVTQETRKHWFHAPWMNLKQDSTHYILEQDSNHQMKQRPIYLGREYIHGMTFELPSPAGKLGGGQLSPCQNWAISLYNAPGGSTIGRVWQKASQFIKPTPEECLFPEGTVAIKLLFTEADEKQVSSLQGAPQWDAHIFIPHPSGVPTDPQFEVKQMSLQGSHIYAYKRTVKQLRLLQIDVAVRDHRAPKTGWVFGTFVYSAPLPGQHRHFTGVARGKNVAWDDVVPLGLTWGNDCHVVPGDGKPLAELVKIPTDAAVPYTHGWGGRLDGPVDNPQSSCLSCHSTAMTYRIANNAFVGPFPKDPMFRGFDKFAQYLGKPESALTKADARRVIDVYFRNLDRGEPFVPYYTSTDFSLQLTEGLHNLSNCSELASPGHGTNGNFLLDPRIKGGGQSSPIAPRYGR